MVTTGFYPARITFNAVAGGVNGNAKPGGISYGDDANRSVHIYDDNQMGSSGAAGGWAVFVRGLGGSTAGTVSAKSSTGFTFNTAQRQVDSLVQYEAFSQ